MDHCILGGKTEQNWTVRNVCLLIILYVHLHVEKAPKKTRKRIVSVLLLFFFFKLHLFLAKFANTRNTLCYQIPNICMCGTQLQILLTA